MCPARLRHQCLAVPSQAHASHANASRYRGLLLRIANRAIDDAIECRFLCRIARIQPCNGPIPPALIHTDAALGSSIRADLAGHWNGCAPDSWCASRHSPGAHWTGSGVLGHADQTETAAVGVRVILRTSLWRRQICRQAVLLPHRGNNLICRQSLRWMLRDRSKRPIRHLRRIIRRLSCLRSRVRSTRRPRNL